MEARFFCFLFFVLGGFPSVLCGRSGCHLIQPYDGPKTYPALRNSTTLWRGKSVPIAAAGFE